MKINGIIREIGNLKGKTAGKNRQGLHIMDLPAN